MPANLACPRQGPRPSVAATFSAGARPPLPPPRGAQTRFVVFHVDDLGMCHAANEAFLHLVEKAEVASGSIMVPCPWFSEIAEAGCANPSLDLGVHLTLTSEWKYYRWRPISTRNPSSGLIDADGYFWRDVTTLAQHVVIEAAEAELRAQVERAFEVGLRPTHIDAHMAAALLPELLDVHVRLAFDYGLFPVLPRNLSFAPNPARYKETVARLQDWKMPLLDHFCGTQAVPEAEVVPSYRNRVENLHAGVTHFALHCTAPGDFEAISSQHAIWRLNEYRLFASGAVSSWCQNLGIVRVGVRDLQMKWQHSLADLGTVSTEPDDQTSR